MLGDPAAEGVLSQVSMAPDQVLLTNARLRYAGLVQPLDVIQAQPLCFRAFLICSMAHPSQAHAALQIPLVSQVRQTNVAAPNGTNVSDVTLRIFIRGLLCDCRDIRHCMRVLTVPASLLAAWRQ